MKKFYLAILPFFFTGCVQYTYTVAYDEGYYYNPYYPQSYDVYYNHYAPRNYNSFEGRGHGHKHKEHHERREYKYYNR